MDEKVQLNLSYTGIKYNIMLICECYTQLILQKDTGQFAYTCAINGRYPLDGAHLFFKFHGLLIL
jgi:hypothetical protein